MRGIFLWMLEQRQEWIVGENAEIRGSVSWSVVKEVRHVDPPLHDDPTAKFTPFFRHRRMIVEHRLLETRCKWQRED